MKKNVTQINSDQCYGCELCGTVCGTKAIQFVRDAEGFVYPEVKEEVCVNCGLCFDFCPANESNIRPTDHNKKVYAMSLKDSELLRKSSSGGAAFAFMSYAIREKYVVFGVKYDDDFKGCHYEPAIDMNGVECFRGTKYIQAKKNNIYRELNEYISQGRRILFIGLPCEVAACKLFLKDNANSVVFIELVCHGVTSPRVASEYISYLERKKSNIRWMTIREKKYGWTPACIRVEFENSKSFSRLFDSTEYGFAFRNISRMACYNCKYKGDNRVADISIGDFWGANSEDEFWDSNGVSVVFVHSEEGRRFIDEVEKNSDVSVTETTYEKGIENNSLILRPRSMGIRKKYSEIYRSQGIFAARRKTEGIKGMSTRLLRNLYYHFKRQK